MSSVGLGCMGFSHGYGATPKRQGSVNLIRYAFELGCTHFDTAEGYEAGENELLIGEALRIVRELGGYRHQGLDWESSNHRASRRAGTRSLEASLKRSGLTMRTCIAASRKPTFRLKSLLKAWASSLAKERFAAGDNRKQPPNKFAARTLSLR